MVDVHQTDVEKITRFFGHWIENFIGLPEILFHYTDSAGLEGIVRQSKIRLTNVAYLNDSSEYVRSAHRIHLALEAVTDLEKRAGVKFMFERLRERLRETQKAGYLPPPLTFVASFTGLRDNLGQWRGYGGSQAGFSMGFDAIRLTKAVSNSNGYLIRCIYEDEVLNSFVRNLLEHIGGVYDSRPSDHEGTADEYADALLDLYANHLEWIVPVFKDPAFRDENEFRIIQGRGAVTLDNIVFDPKPSILSGYVEIDLTEPDDHLMPLVAVDIGPSSNSMLSRYAVEALLGKHGYNQDIVARSAIPFRTF